MEDPQWATAAPPEHLDSCCTRDILDSNHLRIFTAAMSNLLSTDIAEQTFAQIIDGLPLRDVAFSLRDTEYTIRDPVFTHIELCPGVLEKTSMFRDNLHSSVMELRTDVLRRYQEVPAGSRASKLPLLELIAVAVHTIAADLFELDTTLHKRDTPCTSYRGDEGDDVPRVEPWPTTFAVHSYTDTEQLPRGIADVAGYWAEDIIFGGVVLFGRGESGTGYDGVWFQSHFKGVTYRIYSLTDEQLGSLLRFLEWDPESEFHQQGQRPECPLPILGNENNLNRVDPDVAIPMHNVFRDRWESKVAWESYEEYTTARGWKGRPKNELDYPEVRKRHQAIRQRNGYRRDRPKLGEYMDRIKNGDRPGAENRSDS